MPNREQRRSGNAQLGKRIHVVDAAGNPFDIYLSDISGKDEADFLQQMQSMGVQGIGLCDLFFKGEPSLVGIAGLVWAQRRRWEKKLLLSDVLTSINMACIESLELHDPDEEDDESGVDPTRVQPVSSVNSDRSDPVSVPSTG